ncbi:multidrug resistance protein NorM [Lachnospiraceae bacterium]|nr:multidrug resistance protein NorM [Lachnospiraceae bacterium]
MFRLNKTSTQELNKIAIPLIIQNISSFLIGFVDEMFIGRISTEAYGAIGVATSLTFFIAGVFSYAAVAFNIIGSRKIGEKNTDDFRKSLMASLIIDVFIGLIYAITIILIGKRLFRIVYGFSGEALTAALTYIYITSPYMLFQMIIFTFHSYFKIKKKTKYIMWGAIGATVLNTVLDYVLIFGKCGLEPMGVAGVATASMISVLINMLIYIWIGRKDIRFLWKDKSIYIKEMTTLIKTSLPLAGEELLEGSVFVVVINALIAQIGIIEIGAYLLIKKIIDMIMIPMFMYGSAVLTLVSENTGQKDQDRIMKTTETGVVISILLFLVGGLIVIFFRKQVPRLISEDDVLISFASTIMFPMVLMNFFNPIQTIYKYALQAYGDGNFVLYAAAFVHLIILGFILIMYWMNPTVVIIFVGLFLSYLFNYLIYRGRLRKQLSN